MKKMTKEYKEKHLLCSWDFCASCINFRIRNKMPIPELKSDGNSKPYFRLKHPDWKPCQPRKIKV